MNRKFVLIGLWVVVVLALVEVSYYFVIGKNTGIPTISDIFSPTVFSPYIKQAEGIKEYYPQRLNDFTASFGFVASSKSSFVKTAEANYVVGGTVSSISVVASPDSRLGYDITLKNLKDETYVEHLSPTEVQYAKVFVRTPTSFNIARSAKTFTDIKIGDYVAIKRSTNLLNSAEVNIVVEILN